jgi:hypothetical protein
MRRLLDHYLTIWQQDPARTSLLIRGTRGGQPASPRSPAHYALSRTPPAQPPSRGPAPRRSPARSPKSEPISSANQFTDLKREIPPGKHQVTAPHPRLRPSGPGAEIGTAFPKSSNGSSQVRTSRRSIATRVSHLRPAERPRPTTGAAFRTGLRSAESAGTQPRPTLRAISGAGTERCPTHFPRQPPVHNAAQPSG